MVEKKATKVCRAVKIGGQVHRLTVILESDRPEGRHYIDGVCVDPTEFDRIMTLIMIPAEGPS